MRELKFLIFYCIASCSLVEPVSAQAHKLDAIGINSDSKEKENSQQSYSTKFGLVKFAASEGSGGLPDKILLNESYLINLHGKADAQNNTQHLMPGNMLIHSGIDIKGKIKLIKNGPIRVNRLLVFEGPDFNCIKHFLILALPVTSHLYLNILATIRRIDTASSLNRPSGALKNRIYISMVQKLIFTIPLEKSAGRFNPRVPLQATKLHGNFQQIKPSSLLGHWGNLKNKGLPWHNHADLCADVYGN
ncbi:MAG: hypothetical protein V4857_20240 [Pseudomonadota bacterium]